MSHRRHAGRVLASIVLLAAVAVTAGPAGAAPKTITEFAIKSPANQPGDMTVGTDGNIWFVDQGTNKIGHITKTGAINGFLIPTAKSNPIGITTGSDGAVWFTEAAAHRIGRVTGGPTFKQFLLPANTSPRGITAGPDGNLYFVEFLTHSVHKINPTTHALSLVANLPAGSGPTRITSGPDGNLWVSETNLNKVARVTPAGVVRQVTLLTNSKPSRITGGPDGNIWVTEPGRNHIAKITTAATPVVSQVTVPGGPTGIASDGTNLYVTSNTGNTIDRVTTAGVVKTFAIKTAKSGPTGVVMGADGNAWFSENAGNKIGRLSSASGHSSYVIVNDHGFLPASQGIPLSTGTQNTSTTVRWVFQTGKSHSVTDSSGMGLFDSGPMGPGAGFPFQFTMAGRFAYRSTVVGDTMHGTIVVTPRAAKSGSDIIVTVATSHPGGFTSDVFVKAPGSGAFVSAGNTSGNTLTYTPSAGTGTYRFQVRAVNGANTSGFSPTVSVAF
jgi:streptogramin lyase